MDHFGNLISDISTELLQSTWGGPATARYAETSEPADVEVSLAGRKIGPLKAAYAFAESGEPLTLINSMSLVEVAVNGGRACDMLDAGINAEIRLARQSR